MTVSARLAVLVQICAVGFAFQASDESPANLVLRPRRPAAEDATLRINSSLVLVPVHVTAASGATVTGLKKEDFLLFEDGVPQRITHFAQDDAPVSAGVLLDVSGSMKNKLQMASDAATSFFQYANPQDEFFLVEFNTRPKLKIPFTHDWSSISSEIARAKSSGWTAMLDAIHLALAHMKQARNTRKALIILSDGGENFSRRNLVQLRSTLIEAGVQVYALGVFDRNYSVKHTAEERNGPRLLDTVAVDSGGRDFPVGSREQLPSIGVQMARELRNQYILGYTPAASATDGKYHSVKLQLVPLYSDHLRTYYRQGYYAPNE
jgi:VWFA-related protein